MEDNRKRLRQEIGLFRYGLIADLVHLASGHGSGLYLRLHEEAALDYRIPGSSRTRVAAETMRDWLALYRKGGFDASCPACAGIAARRGRCPRRCVICCSRGPGVIDKPGATTCSRTCVS
jgi:hypothetical protein